MVFFQLNVTGLLFQSFRTASPETLDMRMRFIADRNEPLANVIQRLNELGDLKVVINENRIEVR